MPRRFEKISLLNKTKVYPGEKLENLNIICENLKDGLILLNFNLQIIYVNKLVNSQLNIVFEKSFLNYFDYNAAGLILLKIRNCLRKKNNKNNTEKIVFSSLENIPEKITLVLISLPLNQKESSKFLLKIKDITKKIKNNKKKVKLLNNISHELRTPLFNIQSFIETLTTYINKLEKKNIKEFLVITKNEILRLNKLVNTILEVSKIQLRDSYVNESTDIIEIFNQLLSIYTIRLNKKKIQVQKNIKIKNHYIFGKNDVILQILDNLLGNAFKFSSFNSQIILRAYLIKNFQDRKIRVEIGDSGIGIPKNEQINIFRRFFRLEEKIKLIYGTGLGLNIVKKILQKHKIDFYLSSSPNEGTIFLLDFKLSI